MKYADNTKGPDIYKIISTELRKPETTLYKKPSPLEKITNHFCRIFGFPFRPFESIESIQYSTDIAPECIE